MMASFYFSGLFHLHKYLQWKHKKEHKTVVGDVVNTPEIELFPILLNRLEEEDGPTAVDDLEVHAGGRGALCPEPTLPAILDQPDRSDQSYSNRKRSKRRMNDFEESGRQPQTKKVREYVQLSQDPAIVDGFDAETLPAALGAYSSLRLAKTKQKTPLIEKLMEEGYQYIAAEDVGDSFKWVDFISTKPRFYQPLLGRQGRLLIRRSASLRCMRECRWTTATWTLAPAFSILFKESFRTTSFTQRNKVTTAAILYRLISVYLRVTERQMERDSRRENMKS
jgi:hypothetical protein